MSRIGSWIFRPAVGVLFLIILEACSATRLAYENADFLLLRWVDRYIEPTESQEEILEVGLQRALEKHRAELLPDYVLYLREAAELVADGLTRSEVQCLVATFEELYTRTVELIIPLAAVILADLNEAQIPQLTRRLEKDDARFVRDWLQQEQRQRLAKRGERIVGHIEDWTGGLFVRQAEFVTESTLAFPDTAPSWYQYRLEQQGELLSLVSAGVDAGEIDAFLREWWIAQRGLGRQLSVQIEAAIDGFIDMIAGLDETLTREQRDRVISRLISFADALEPALGSGERLVIFERDSFQLETEGSAPISCPG